MKIETKLFLYLAPFFVAMATIYGVVTARSGHFEPVGTAAMLLTGLLVLMVGVYLAMTARRIDERPEDDPEGEIAEREGSLGQFSPWSWWPLVLGLTAATAFAGLAVGWWLFGVSAIIGMIGLIGWVFEFSGGQHRH